jgi:hypothetical protein
MPRCGPLISSAFDVPLFPIEVKSTVLLRQNPSRRRVQTFNAEIPRERYGALTCFVQMSLKGRFVHLMREA